MIPIVKIDVSELTSEFGISKRDTDDLKEEILSGLINNLYYFWQEAVKNSQLSDNTKKIYSRSLDIFKEGRFKGGVGILRGNRIWLINAIEQGLPAFDMKEGMLKSKKVKTGKLGQQYITIPFRIGIPETGFRVTMSNPTYQIARTLKGKQQLKQRQLKGKDAEIRTRPFIQTQTKIYNEYKHKSSVFVGIQHDTGKGHGHYMTMRRISNASQPQGSDPESWIHRGIVAYKLAEVALDKTDVNNLTDNIIQDFLGQKFG